MEKSKRYRDVEIRAPRGKQLTAKSWLTEAPLRMLMNNLDPDVAENPRELVVYGGIGRAARDWDCYDRIVESLKNLNEDETLLVQSGKPVGVFKTHANAPRVLIANSNLVPHWATWEHFNELDARGLAMYGQMTAGSWIYIGSQGIVQGTYETFVEAGRQHYDGKLAGRWVLTAGLGGMGGAQPLAATLAGACSLNIECQQSSIDFRLRTRYVDEQAADLDDALARIARYTKEGRAISIALCGNAAEILPELVRRGVRRTWSPTRPAPMIRSTAICPSAGPGPNTANARKASRPPWSRRPSSPWPGTCAPCSNSRSRACPPSTTATTSARWPRKKAWTMPSTCPHISARCSAVASALRARIYPPAVLHQLRPAGAHLLWASAQLALLRLGWTRGASRRRRAAMGFHGGGVGMGFSQHSGMVIVCDGTDAAAERIARVLTNDPGTGVMRHADAGYEIAIDCAREQGLNLPMITGR